LIQFEGYIFLWYICIVSVIVLYVFIQFINENIIGIFQILFEADPSQVIPIIKLLTSLLCNEC